LQAIWNRPTHLQTVVDNQPSLLSFDGSAHTMKTLGDSDDPRKQAAKKTS
jgi:stage V sporulation protein R